MARHKPKMDERQMWKGLKLVTWLRNGGDGNRP